MIIEVLFDESCNLFGDGQNAAYLKATLPTAQFVYTKITDVPYFAQQDPDMIYIGSMSESVQRRVIEKLMPYKERLMTLIEKGTPILATGNAGEIFCKKIPFSPLPHLKIRKQMIYWDERNIPDVPCPAKEGPVWKMSECSWN